MTKPPSISIVTPNYNHAAYLERCVRSIAAQVVAPLEHVIVDDGSTDNSREILLDLAARYDFVRVFFNEKNEGTPVSTHRAMQEARGDFIIGLAADDVLLPEAIGAFAGVIARHPDAALICGELEYQKGEKKWHRRYITASEPVYLSPERLALYQRGLLTVVNGASMVRRSLAMASPLCDRRLRWHGDLLGYTMISYRHGLWYLPRIIHHFAIHDDNMSANAQQWRTQKDVLDRIFELLRSAANADVFRLFRTSAALAEVPMILRYMALRPSVWRFFTPRLVLNGLIFWTYRVSRKSVPQAWIDAYIDHRSRRAG